MTDEHPRAGVEYPRNWHELLDWFPDDAACLRYLERLRWGRGWVYMSVLRSGRRWLVADERWAAPLRGLSVRDVGDGRDDLRGHTDTAGELVRDDLVRGEPEARSVPR